MPKKKTGWNFYSTSPLANWKGHEMKVTYFHKNYLMFILVFFYLNMTHDFTKLQVNLHQQTDL